MQVRACSVVRRRLAAGIIHVSIQGGPLRWDQPGRTGGDGGIQCVPAPALVRGEVQVDRHSIAVLGLSCSHSENHSRCPSLTCTSPLGAFQAMRPAP